MQADSNGDEVNLTGNVLGDAWSLATGSGTLVLLVTSATVPPRSWTVHRGAGARTRVVRPHNPVAAAPYELVL